MNLSQIYNSIICGDFGSTEISNLHINDKLII